MTFVKTALFHKAGEGSGGGGGGGDQHNLGWYATESALTTAHPTATDGDWAIVGATDTVWVWDSDSTAWKDTGAAGIELPDQTGHSGEFLITNGTNASWGDQISQIKLGFNTLTPNQDVDFLTIYSGTTVVGKIQASAAGPRLWSSNGYWGVRIANKFVPEGASLELGANIFGSVKRWKRIYVQYITYGTNDITVPDVAGEMAVKQVNTTIALTAAGWSSNTQTVTVSGMTATGVVLVSPDPTDQSAYTSAGIICTAQAADSLTFTCTSTPSADIDVNVVML